MALHGFLQPRIGRWGIKQCFHEGDTVASAQLHEFILADSARCRLYRTMDDEIGEGTALNACGLLAQRLGFRADSRFESLYLLRYFLWWRWRYSRTPLFEVLLAFTALLYTAVYGKCTYVSSLSSKKTEAAHCERTYDAP